MNIEDRQKLLRDAVGDLKKKAKDMTHEERQDGLIDVGCAASRVDLASLDHLEMESIKDETDRLVNEAEAVVAAITEVDALNKSLSTRVRGISNKRSRI